MPATKIAKTLSDFASKYKINLILEKAPPESGIVPLPSKPFIDFVDYEHALRSPAFIHDRNHDGECFLCDNADALIYETKRATMIKEAGTDLCVETPSGLTC